MTITAKNYAAQAEKDLQLLHDKVVREKYKPALKAIIDIIHNSVKFAIPDNGYILDDGYKGLFNTELDLPYEGITIEYFKKGDLPTKILLYAVQHPDDGIFFGFAIANKNTHNHWMPSPLSAEIPNGTVFPYEEGVRLITILHFEDEELFAIEAKEFEKQVWPLFEFLEALSCKNITTATHQKEDKVHNYRRIKKGKLPFYETKILVIDTKEKLASQQQTRTGTHASPRQHLRRGHIRRLPSGNYWVNSCVVGDAEKGTIHKQYAVL